MKVVVFIDCQKDFLKNGVLAYGYPVEDNFQKVIDFAKECADDPDCKIYATRDTHEKTEYFEEGYIENSDKLPEGTKALYIKSGYFASLEGQKLPVEHCIEGTNGWMIDDRLMEVLDRKCTFVNKPTFGSYDLVEIINEDIGGGIVEDTYTGALIESKNKLDEIIVCGYDLSICVISNALLLRAKFPDVKITIKSDCCGCISKETFDTALSVAKCCQIDII